MALSTNAEPAARQTWVGAIDRSIGGFGGSRSTKRASLEPSMRLSNRGNPAASPLPAVKSSRGLV